MRSELARRGLLVALIGFAFLSVGAKGQSCSAEIDPGDGSAASWPTGPIPTAAAKPEPMTCAWLSGDNCWKRLVAKANACAKDASTSGTFASDRKSCSYPAHGRWEFEGDVATPGPDEVHVPIMNWRVLDAEGAPCMTGKILGIGRTMLDVQGEVALFENTSLTTYQVTCPDGSTFTNDTRSTGSTFAGAPGPAGGAGAAGGSAASAGAAGSAGSPGSAGASTESGEVCTAFGARWLAKETPGIAISCAGGPKVCKLELWGGPQGVATPTTCGW